MKVDEIICFGKVNKTTFILGGEWVSNKLAHTCVGVYAYVCRASHTSIDWQKVPCKSEG